MVAVIDKKLVFGREQVLTSTQASKNFGEASRSKGAAICLRQERWHRYCYRRLRRVRSDGG